MVGHAQIVNPDAGCLLHEGSICPEFSGGIIFLKKNEPVRLYLCQTNQIVTDAIGHKFGTDDILSAIRSEKVFGNTGKTLKQLLDEKGIEVAVDNEIKSKYISAKNYASKNHVVLESADCMGILRSSTFLDDEKHWENLFFNPNLIIYVGVVSRDFEINIEHKGYLIGCKNNAEGLVDEVNGLKWYGLALQIGKEHSAMVEFAKNFAEKVGFVPSEKAKCRTYLNKSLLDRNK